MRITFWLVGFVILMGVVAAGTLFLTPPLIEEGDIVLLQKTLQSD